MNNKNKEKYMEVIEIMLFGIIFLGWLSLATNPL